MKVNYGKVDTKGRDVDDDLQKNRYNPFNKANLVLIAALCLIAFMQYSFAVDTQSDYMYPAEVTDYRFLPSTINAGDTVSVAVDIYNKGSLVSMENVVLTLDINEGDYLEPVEGSTTTVSSIAKESTKTAILKFKVKDSAISGYYKLFLHMSFERTDYKGNAMDVNQTEVLTVPVSTAQKNIDIEFNPKIISPGAQTPLTISLINNSASSISNVSLSWTESNEVIVPLGSDNKRFVSSIAAGKRYDFNYLVVADPSITTGVYPLDVTLNYTSATGEVTQTSEVGIIVGGKTDFQISYEVSSGTISFSLANIGSNDASAVVVQMPAQNGLTVSGSDTSIIGSIATGDYSVASFTVSESASSTGADQNMPAGAPNMQGTQPTAKDTNVQAVSQRDFNARSNGSMASQGGSYYIDVSYTDTTGERQHIKSTFKLSSTTKTGMTMPTSGSTASRQSGSDSTVLFAVLAVIGLIGVAANKLFMKKNWKTLAMFIGAGIIVPVAIIFVAPTQYTSVVLAAVFLIGSLVLFFKQGVCNVKNCTGRKE